MKKVKGYKLENLYPLSPVESLSCFNRNKAILVVMELLDLSLVFFCSICKLWIICNKKRR